MDVLEPWIAVTVEGELSEALRQWENISHRHQSTGKSQGLSYDDGSNLRIPSAKKGPVVQITKFLTFKDPIQVTLSDSVIRVNASITNQASQRYAEKNRRKITEGTVGGLIQLHEFEIVATHFGPRDKRLTLYVKDFKSLGSDGSGNFGVAPQAIESREGTKELLKKLADLRKDGLDVNSRQLAADSPMKSQPSTQTSEAGHDQDDQVGFATQVPRSVAPSVSKSRSLGSTTSVKIDSTSANSAKSLAPPMEMKPGIPSEGTTTPLQAKSAPEISKVNHKKALLGLLRDHKRAALAPERNPDPKSGQLLEQVKASSEPVTRETEDQASRIIDPAPSDANAGRITIETQKRKRQSPETSPRKKKLIEHDLQYLVSDCESLPVNHAMENKASSGLLATEASIDTRHNQPINSSILNSTNSHPNISLEPSLNSNSKVTISTSAQKCIRNGISRRDVSIPKDQETLLSRKDSWLPAEPGQREPSANIPISELKRLNQRAALRGQGPIKSRKQRNQVLTPNTIIDPTADSESDAPISSGQWPASPEREQLPPDSSFASADHSDHSARRILTTHRSASSVRRLSNASLSSHSMPSGSPSPISPRPSLRESAPLDTKSFTAFSPSVTSNSAGEESRCFACQVPGCDKSYKRSGRLKAHVDRHHPSAKSSENVKCPLKDGTRSSASPGSLKNHVERQHNGYPLLSSRCGKATPTPDASTPVSPSLKSWSGRDGGTEQKLCIIEANNEFNSIGETASMLPLMDGGLNTLPDKQLFRRPSSMESGLGSNIPSDTLPTAIQRATTDLPSSPILASPSSESDLDLTIPLALNNTTDSIPSSAPTQSFPCTASQPQDSFTQVKRTPYVNGHAQDKSLPVSRVTSPLGSNLYPLTNGNISEDTEFVSASITSGPRTTTETHGQTRSSHMIEDQRTGNDAARHPEEIHSQQVADISISETQQAISKIGLVANKTDDTSLSTTENQRQSQGFKQPGMLQKANIKSPVLLEKSSIPEGNPGKPPPQLSTSNHAVRFANELKRKSADECFISSGFTKRQKRFKIPSAFTFTERSDVPRDPSERARQYRQEFLASRRSSESSTPTVSPTMSFTFFPRTTPESPRDPSERARQLRQEFLTSRRSSETSTPATSPKRQFTALTRTIEARCRNAEMETNTEQVPLQTQSVYTGFERRKMAELKNLAVTPQSHGLDLDATALPNSTAFIDINGDDAKPGAQDNVPLDHQTKSPLLAAQNVDVEGPDTKRGSVVMASFSSSNDEMQRVRSVELDVSIPSSDHGDAVDGYTRAKDEANQTINLGIESNVVNHDQSENSNKESRPVEPDLEKARQGLPTRADEVAEQEVSLPTPRAILDHLAEPENALSQSIHEQLSVCEDLDAQVPDPPVSGSITQQRSGTMDVKTRKPDEIIMEPTSDQQLIRVDKKNRMADVQVSQDNPSSKNVAHSGEPLNHTITLSSVVSAVVTDSKTENQQIIPPTTFGPAISLSNPMPDSKVESLEKHQDPVQLPSELTKQDSPSVDRRRVDQSVFDRFKATYPTYPGDMKHFAAVCSKISQLVKLNRMEHQSLWDDYIVRHKVDYSQYLRRCAEEAEDAVPYEIFYQTEVEGPQYRKRVINRQNLDEALALFARQPSFEQVRAEPIGNAKSPVKQAGHQSTSMSNPITGKIHHQYSLTKNDEALELRGTKSASRHKPAASYEPDREPSKSRIVIDLTEEDLPGDPPKCLNERDIAPQTRLLPLINGVSVEPPSLQNCQDSQSSLYQVPSTPPNMRGSLVLPSPQQVRSPPVPVMTSTQNATKSLRRSLPWEDSDHNLLQSSPKGKASDSSRGLRGSGLRENHAKGFSNAQEARSRLSANPTLNGPKKSQYLMDTCHRVIQSNWGIKPQELLEPEYQHGPVWSETMIELLAEIASKVNLGEARDRIKAAMDTRISDNARRGASRSSQERKLLKSDLEVVRGVVATSSMSTTNSFSPPHTDTVVEKQTAGTSCQWWEDVNSPFKSFARAYASIRHGNGNSFAKNGPVESPDGQRAEGNKSRGVELKNIDITRWNL